MQGSLWEACRLDPRVPVAVIGGGGKTTILMELARTGGPQGSVTTTTRMWLPAEPWLSVEYGAPSAGEGWRFYARGVEGNKVWGLSPEEVDELAGLRPQHPLLIEADGSKGRPLKVHREDEPVLPSCAGQTLVVVGMSALGRAFDEESVHRSGLWGAGGMIDVALMGDLVERMLGRVCGARVVLNQVDCPPLLEAGRQLARRFDGVPVVARSHSFLQRL